MRYILAIDQGTTGSRAVLFDKQARCRASAYAEFRQYFPRPGWVEHDPREIWRSVYASIQDVLRQVPDAEIAGIGITNQRETACIWDRTTGMPVYNAIVWQCRRTAERCRAIQRRGEAAAIRKITGLPVDAYFSATKIEWILKHVPGAMSRARQGKLAFGTTDAWILWQLTAGKIHATDYTNASRTMVFDIEQRRWEPSLLKMFKIPMPILPEVKPSSGSFGATARIGRLAAGIPIAGIAGDQQAALFGQACFEPGTIKNTYGTGCFILLNAGKKRPVSKCGLITTLACGPQGEPVYALEGAVFIAGAAVQWLRDCLKIIRSAAETERLARTLPDNEGVYFVPALVGLGAPYWDPDARGAIFGLTRGTTARHIVRAALEAMCYATKDVLSAMQKDTGLKISELKVDGGAAANNFLCQFQADILRAHVIRPRIIESTALGAAYLAGLGVGFWKDTAHIKKYWQEDARFRPRMSRPRAAEYYQRWLAAVRRTRSS